MKPARRTVIRRVITPFGELTAAALAAIGFERQEPEAVWEKIDLIETELDFDIEDADDWDDASRSR